MLIGIGVALILLRAGIDVFVQVTMISGIASIIPDIDLKYKHRKLMHNITACLLASLIVMLLTSSIMYFKAFIIGYLTHILLDMTTIRGVYLFYPVSNKSVRIANLRSDSFMLNMIGNITGLALILAWLIMLFRA